MNFDDLVRRSPEGLSPWGRFQNREVHDRMSELTAAPDTGPTADDFVDIRVDEILIGSTLDHPLCDQTGVLLLAEGTTINAKVKEKLRLRKIHTVRVSPADARRITLDATAIGDRPTISLHAEIAKKLDSYLEQGILFVKNEGAALKEQMVVNGPKIFDKARRDEILMQHQATCESLDSMMREAIQGRQLNARQITQLIAIHLTHMMEDNQHVLSVAMNADQRGLSEQAVKTALLGMTIGAEMQLNADNVRLLGLCGLVHDWGMAMIPESVVKKLGRLNEIEFLEIQKHPVLACELLQQITGIPPLVPLVVYQIHERMNGSGYPRGRRGQSIHLFARILNVADVYTALTTGKSYRPPLSPYAAMECLIHQAAEQTVDPKVVKALLRTFGLFPVGSFVALDDGSIAQVIRPNPDDLHAPTVQLVRNARGEDMPAADESVIELSVSERKVIQAIPTPGKNEIAFSPELLSGSAGGCAVMR